MALPGWIAAVLCGPTRFFGLPQITSGMFEHRLDSRHWFGLAFVLVLASVGLSVLAAPDLPDELVTHWNAAGEPDGRMGKTAGLFLIPVLTAGLLVLFAAIPWIDPLRENIVSFRGVYDQFVVVLTLFMAGVHASIIAFNLGYRFDFTLLVVAGVSGLYYCVGVLLDAAERNWFVGIRTPWTLSSETVWERTHEVGARLFKVAAVVGLLGLLAGPSAVYIVIVAPLLITVLTVAYSYRLYQRLEEEPAPLREPD